MKLKEWLPVWLENYIKPSAKDRTVTRYTGIISNHLVPALGDYELSELSPLLLQQYITGLMKDGNIRTGEGLSANTVNIMITVLQSALHEAHILGELPDYTADKLKRPRVKEKEIFCFSVVEQKQVEQAVLSDKRIKMFGILLSLYTGLRIGELLSLEWSDIDFEKSEVSVTKTCHDSKKDGKYFRLTDIPKTSTSRRIVPIPRQLLPLLRDVKKKNRSRWVVGNGEDEISVRSYQYSFALLLKKLNLPHRGFHSLRHTFATRQSNREWM